MKTHDVEQGSLEWLMLRSGIPTASEMDALITPRFAIKKGEGPQTYLAKKVAEKWQGGPLPSFGAFATEQGSILEDADAVPWFELEYNTTVQRVGFITTDDGRAGCSPDGLLDGECGLEIKCPAAHTHVNYLLKGVLPEDYAIQVHTSMFVTGYKRWKFLSYRRHFPALLLTIERDEAIQEVISQSLDEFLQKFDEAMARLTEINGGGPPRLKPLTPIPPKAEREKAKPFVLHEQEVTP